MTATANEYTLYPKVTANGTMPPKVLERLDERYWNHSELDPASFGGGGWSNTVIADARAGIEADGVTNDQPAIQALLDANPGALISFPAGTYMLRGYHLIPRGGATLQGEPGTRFVTDDPAMADFIRIAGSYTSSSKAEVAETLNAGDRTITTKTPHGYRAGDVVRLISQRRATTRDAGEDQLGWQTIGGPGPFFAEFVTVETVTSPTTFDTTAGIVFNGYRPDNSQETESDAGTSAYVQMTNGSGDNTTVRGIHFENSNLNGLIRVVRAVDVRIEKCTFRIPGSGRAIGMEDCYRSEALDCHAVCDTVLYDSGDHALQNLFHIAGSQSSGFRGCSTIRGAQCYDLTYKSTSPYPSVDCYVDSCASYSALYNPITLHPGTYRCRITNSLFAENRQGGIGVRSNSAVITGNVVSGARHVSEAGVGGAGIYLYEGAGKNSIVSGNLVENFATGLRVNDGGGKPTEGWIGSMFTDNVVRNFDVGFVRIVNSGEPIPTVPQGIVIDGNLFESRQDDAIGVLTCDNGRGVNGVQITGNTLRLPGAGTRGVVVTGNSVDTVVRGNTFAQVGQALAWDPVGVTDSSPESVVHWSGNSLLGVRIDRTPPPGPQFQIHSPDGTVHTMPTDSYSLNYARWNARFYSTPSSATVARGWPVEGFEGYVDVVRMSSSLVQQTGWGADGRRHTRTWTAAGGWTSWKVA